MVWVDAEGRLLELNLAAEAMTGRTRKSALETPAAALFPELAEWLGKEGAVRGTIAVETAEGTRRTMAAALSALSDEGVRVLELTDLQGVLEEARAGVERDVRAANATLLRNLAHEIKNPLGGIRGAAQLLRSELTNPDDLECVGVVLSETERLMRLTERILSPYRPQRADARANLLPVLERVRRVVEKDLPESVELVRDYDISLPAVKGDEERLTQVFLNLATNALEALARQGGGGTVRIRTRIVRDARLLEGPVRQAASVEVEDDGPGVPDELQEQIFYPLVTTRAEGTGLGLALVKSCVEGCGGAVQLESRPGRTVFRVLLPLAPPDLSNSIPNAPDSTTSAATPSSTPNGTRHE
ncbi:putative nitrogen regulation protein NtrB [Sutterella parvirubra YIT 11816]|uniref:histidine kinase n=2 Tax=Sutterella TaxID=40544 RepID=H3KG67_9BURK|nr:putative nitrogen regulation protein NtrB [Sutterella parvirubra YIT 11816]